MGNNYCLHSEVKLYLRKNYNKNFSVRVDLYDVKQPSYDCLANRYPNLLKVYISLRLH